jgi:hypothetical protein
VSGLTPADIAKLFHFEGDEYGIEEITVAPLSSAWEEIGEYDVRRLEGRRQDRMRREPLACSTFMWIGGLGGLEKESWEWVSILLWPINLTGGAMLTSIDWFSQPRRVPLGKGSSLVGTALW